MKKTVIFTVGSFLLLVIVCFFTFKKTDILTQNKAGNSAITQVLPNQSTQSDVVFSQKTALNDPLSKNPIFEQSQSEKARLAIAEKLEKLEESQSAISKQARRLTKEQRIQEAIDHEIRITKDINLGYVPHERAAAAYEKTLRLIDEAQRERDFTRGNITKAKWTERGPNNVGGRTRVIMVDRNDPKGNTVFTGGATGGLFKNTNISDPTSPWQRVDDWKVNLTTSSMAQDPKKPQIMYLGTGDSDGGDARGIGILKSTDGGKKWSLLDNTTGFGVIPCMIVNDSSHIYAGTAFGLYLSKDGGLTWIRTLTNSVNSNNRVYNLQLGKNGRFYAALGGAVYKSDKAGYPDTWQLVSGAGSNFPAGWGRIEIAVAPSDQNTIYAVGSQGGAATIIVQSTNGGTTWRNLTQPTWIGSCGGTGQVTDWARGQANYDLTILVDPESPNTVWIGGIDVFRSVDGGGSWRQVSYWAGCNRLYIHADQHIMAHDPFNPQTMYIGNDGGVFRVTNSGSNYIVTEHDKNLVTTQFYGAAIHPDSAANYFLAGAQDNGTNAISGSPKIGTSREVIGGDGFMCFIDQDEPKIQIGSLYYGAWFVSEDGGGGFSLGASSDGGFYCPADYDSKNNILYAQTGSGDLYRWNQRTKEGGVIDLAGVTTSDVSRVFADPSVNNRIYVGTRSGRLLRVDNAHTGTTIAAVSQVGTFAGTVSSVDVERGNKDHILVTLSNYGARSVWETRDGGTTWVDCDNAATLPDMPVRWGIINPINPNSALIATDFGVWSTELLNGNQTKWTPPIPGRGTPLVRTDQLAWRNSDKTVLACTYGRGVWTTKALGKEAAEMEYQRIGYLNVPMIFSAEQSSGADSYLWNFTTRTDTNEVALNPYSAIGKYDVSLTINGNNATTKREKLQILPSLPTPYKGTTTGYAGGGEGANSNVHFGWYSESGSQFSVGNSNFVGKAGSHAGLNTFVLGVNEQQYQKNTIAYLYTPNYDLTQKSIYTFSFWAQYDFQNGYDGMQVEYTLDKGITWSRLGTNDAKDWYGYRNTSLPIGAFSIGESYFSGTTNDWTRFKFNLSSFAGSANVAFRFVVRTADNNRTQSAGIAIDDIVLSKYEGELKTAIVVQGGTFAKDVNAIDIRFQSQPEYFAKSFELEMSENGTVWKKINTFVATGVTSDELQDYNYKVLGTAKDLYYFRIKSINNDASSNYSYDFYTPPFVVKRSKDAAVVVNTVFPSPFTNTIGVTFTDIVDAAVEMNLYDDLGRLIATQTTKPNSIYQDLKINGLAKGIYLLTVKIGDAKPETYKLFGGN